MQDAVTDRRLLDGHPDASTATVGLSIRLPNGGVVHVDAPVGQSISAVLLAQGVPLKRAIVAGVDGACGGLGVAKLPARMGCDATVRPEHDGLEIMLDAASIEPQTYWTAG